ncbi:MAG: hypothetical protein K9G44_05115 [Melioribacteraceae bacterium]|nr:hypothetical protein [Melioribacteraceae bacterium]
MKNSLFIIILIAFSFTNAFSQSIDDLEENEQNSLKKPTTSEDDAFGILDKGELVNTVGNQGMISDSYYQNLIYNFRWPKSKGLANMSNDVNAMDDLCILFASKGNVLDSYTRYRAEDWMAPPGALGKYHADDQPANLLAPDGAPRLAHSDIPVTWPKGFFDDSGSWVDAPSGSYVTLSESNKNLVDSKGAFYDADNNVWHFWPGKFRKEIDPTSPNFGNEVPGEFAADREIYMIMTDHSAQPPSTPMGLTLEIQAYSYGRRFAQDIHFYDITITNSSNQTLDSCYYGYYADFQFGDVLEETYGTFNTGINPNGYDNGYYQFDYNGSSPGNPEVGVFGFAVLKTPFDLGITDGHFFRDLTGNTTPADDNSIWPVMISDPNSPKLMSAKENYFHGPDPHFDDFSLTGEGKQPGPSNWTLFTNTGPFSLAPGESMEATLAVTVGNDFEDLMSNVDIAQSLYLNSFLGPSTPPSPKLNGVEGDGRVTLYWNDSAEKVVDLVSKRRDFQGYKIYRSQDQGASWGKQILDSKSNLVGYVPIAQFDKDDLVQGIDPFNNFNYLGDNTGIVHYFVDSTVTNGVNYSYTITSYDSGSVSIGLESLESARGTTAADYNLVDLTPRTSAIGFAPGEFSYTQIKGVGNGTVQAKIIDPTSLTGKSYLIEFNATPADSFFLVDNSNKQFIGAFIMNSSEGLIVEGITVNVSGDDATGEIKKITNHLEENVSGVENTSSDGNWYVNPLSTNALANRLTQGTDYEFRFTAENSFAAGLTGNNKPMIKKYEVPFQIWNVGEESNIYQVGCILLDNNKNNEYDLGEEIRIINSPYIESDTIGVFSLLNWYYSISIDTVAGMGGNKPLDGESFRIYSMSELTALDTFRLEITPPKVEPTSDMFKSQINNVKVVPNPFIVNAAWEQIENNRRLRFMYLPPECTISIYNVRGELIDKIYHDNLTGDEDWNLTNSSGVEIAFGVYLYVIQTPTGESTTGKFAVIK